MRAAQLDTRLGRIEEAIDCLIRGEWDDADHAMVPARILRQQPNASGIETKHYSDGSSATGPGPLPDLSPEQQAAVRRTILPHTVDDFPRRNRLDHHTPAEKAIRDALMAVEEVGADVRLTAVSMLLMQAADQLADYLEDRNPQQ
jgi:hypothetical protein